MFQKDRNSIFIFQAALILCSQFNPLIWNLNQTVFFFVPVLGLFLVSVYLLFKLETLQNNSYTSILKKAIKILGLAYILVTISALVIMFFGIVISDIIGGPQSEVVVASFNSVPNVGVFIFGDQIRFLLSLPFAILIAMLLRKKYKPIERKVYDHLVE